MARQQRQRSSKTGGDSTFRFGWKSCKKIAFLALLIAVACVGLLGPSYFAGSSAQLAVALHARAEVRQVSRPADAKLLPARPADAKLLPTIEENASASDLPEVFLPEPGRGVPTPLLPTGAAADGDASTGAAPATTGPRADVAGGQAELPQAPGNATLRVDDDAGFFFPLELEGQTPPPSAVGVGLVLVTSIFFSNIKKHNHLREIYGSIATNLQNPHIKELHLFFEIGTADDVKKKYYELRWHLNKAAGLPHDTVLMKLRWKPIYSTPHYSTFFEYIDRHLSGELVVLTNTDVVFDDTLSLINPNHFATHATAHPNAYVLSVESPMFGGAKVYWERFQKDCPAQRRCSIGRYSGWHFGGRSWDAYIYRAPLPRKFRYESVDFPMFWLRAENSVGVELIRSGVRISNPCLHVHAFHWHCIGTKMHGDHDSSPLPHVYYLVLMPCWDCPGLLRAPGEDGLADLCADGARRPVPVDVQPIFRQPENTELCCPTTGCEWVLQELAKTLPQPKTHMQPSQVQLCRRASDVNCIIHAGREKFSRYLDHDDELFNATAQV